MRFWRFQADFDTSISCIDVYDDYFIFSCTTSMRQSEAIHHWSVIMAIYHVPHLFRRAGAWYCPSKSKSTPIKHVFIGRIIAPCSSKFYKIRSRTCFNISYCVTRVETPFRYLAFANTTPFFDIFSHYFKKKWIAFFRENQKNDINFGVWNSDQLKWIIIF